MMYWSVIGDHSHIEESAMDGSLRRTLLEKNLRRPTGRYLFNSASVFYIHLVHSITLMFKEEHLIGFYEDIPLPTTHS